MLTWPLAKDPDDICRYRFDWGRHRLAPGEAITSSTFIVEGTVVVDETLIEGGFTSFRASGGTHSEACKITNRVVTNNGNQYDWTGRLRIKSTG